MTEERSKSERLFLFGMVMSMLCWGISWASGKILSEYGSALNISFYRFTITFISLFFILIFIKESLYINKKGILDLVIASVLISLYTYLFFKGLAEGKAGAGGVLVTILNPIISYAIMLTMTWRRPTRNEAIGLFFGFIAGIILLKVTTEAEKIFNSGNSYFLLASLSWSVLSVFTAKAARYGSSPVTFSFWMYGISTLIMFLLADKTATMEIFEKGDFKFWGNLFFSATITTSLATTFYFVATSKIGASKASSFIFMVPFSAAIGSWVFLNEIPQTHTLIGGLLGIAAVYILNKKATKNKALKTNDQVVQAVLNKEAH
jgi:drug/metabolite transporter (DMT)-like permease